jgi:hypothetical protein
VARFKVGDFVHRPESDAYKKIIKVEEKRYVYQVLNKLDNSVRIHRKDFSVIHLDRSNTFYYKKLADTEITRKLYKDKIHKEEGGYLWVKN